MNVRVAIAAICAGAPIACHAQSNGVVDTAARGFFSGLLMAAFVMLIVYFKRKDDAAAAVEASKSDLARAAANGKLNAVTALVQSGADVNEQDEDGGTALMLAARNNRGAVVAYLLKHGANSELKTKAGASALGIAKKHASRSIVDAIESKR